MPDFHIYEPLEVPPVEVELDGAWWPGEARMRTTHDDVRLTYQCQYRRDGATFLDVFPAAQVRLDQHDRSRGRTRGWVRPSSLATSTSTAGNQVLVYAAPT